MSDYICIGCRAEHRTLRDWLTCCPAAIRAHSDALIATERKRRQLPDSAKDLHDLTIGHVTPAADAYLKRQATTLDAMRAALVALANNTAA